MSSRSATPSAAGREQDACYASAVHTLDEGSWVVIDLDTGTVVGTNIALVRLPDDDEWRESVLCSDTLAVAHAEQHGIPLYRLDE
jgi:hypothetical protein